MITNVIHTRTFLLYRLFVYEHVIVCKICLSYSCERRKHRIFGGKASEWRVKITISHTNTWLTEQRNREARGWARLQENENKYIHVYITHFKRIEIICLFWQSCAFFYVSCYTVYSAELLYAPKKTIRFSFSFIRFGSLFLRLAKQMYQQKSKIQFEQTVHLKKNKKKRTPKKIIREKEKLYNRKRWLRRWWERCKQKNKPIKLNK